MTPHDVSRDTVRTEIRGLLQEITEGKAAQVSDGDRLREDLGLDSLDSMELLSSLSQRYEVDIAPDDVTDVRTFGDIVDFVMKTLARAEPQPRVS